MWSVGVVIFRIVSNLSETSLEKYLINQNETKKGLITIKSRLFWKKILEHMINHDAVERGDITEIRLMMMNVGEINQIDEI